jgi:hypothetical protein
MWCVVLPPAEVDGYKEVFWRLDVNGVRAAGACQRFFSAPCPCGVVGSGAQGDCERLRQHAFWECAIAQAVRTQVQRGLGGALLQQWHLWLVDPPPERELVTSNDKPRIVAYRYSIEASIDVS